MEEEISCDLHRNETPECGSLNVSQRRARPHNALLVLVLSFIVGLTNEVYVFTQMPQSMTFTTSTPQVRLKANLGQFNTTQQYTLWGWFRFNGEATAISNILTLRNMKEIAASSTVEPYPNPKFPVCPYSLEELNQKPLLMTKSQVLDNPNCFPQRLPVAEKSNPYRKEDDLLFVNFDLNNASPKNSIYSVLFLNQIGKSNTGASDMKIEGFVDLKLTKNTWSFFAISCDYVNGEISIFFYPYDGLSKGNIKTYKVNFPEFSLSKNAELVVASVENNPYFQSTSGFIGDIGLIEMGTFYTVRLDLLWMSYLPQNSYLNNGIELEFLFDGYVEDVLETSSKNRERFEVVGKRQNIALTNPSKVGWNFYADSKVELTNFVLKTEDLVKTMTFYLQFSFEETLIEEFFVVQKGTPGAAGYFGISLVRKESGVRNLRIRARDSKGEAVWNSGLNYEPKKTYRLIAGITVNPAGQLRVVYWDERGSYDFSELNKNFSFDFKTDTSGKRITLFNNLDTSIAANPGYFTFYRFIVLNSASPALLNFLLKDSMVSNLRDSLDKQCKLRTSIYAQNFGCLLCEGTIANLNRTCTNFCPTGFRNGMTDICVPCKDDKCQNSDDNFWTVVRIATDHYQLRPSRPLLNKSIDLSKLVSIYIPNGNSTSFNYTLVPNIEKQYVDIFLTFNQNFVNQTLIIDVGNNSELLLFDENRNLVRFGKTQILIERSCYLEPELKTSMNALAITALVIFLVSFLVLLIFTIVFYNKILDLGSLWKFFLHNWMRLQLVGALYLLGIYMPCCARAFLNIIYDLSIGWNHALGGPINNFNNDNQNFREGMEGYKPPIQFIEQGAFAFILHNMLISFIVHGIIFLTYFIIKIWDWFKTSRAKFMYVFFLFMEFTILIVGYGIFHLQAFIFSGLNFRLALFTTSYFIISFIIAVCYILVFTAFWIYAAVRLLGSSFYFTSPINHARFYYFFAGYRDSKWARTYDLWHWLGYLIIGLMIGIVWENAIVQLSIILAVLVVLFVLSVVLRPWNYLFQLIIELVCQLIFIAVVIILLILAIYDSSSCFDCGNREGGLCLLIVALLFIYLMLLALGLIMQTFLLTFCQGKSFLWGKRAASGIGFMDAEAQHSGYAMTGAEAMYDQNVYNESNIKYSSVHDLNNLARSNMKYNHEENHMIMNSQMGMMQNDMHVNRNVAMGNDNFEEYGYEHYNQSATEIKTMQPKKTMLEFMNDVRRQRENEELDTFVENGGKSEVNIVHGYQGSQVHETDFYRPNMKAQSMISDKADEESMQDRVMGALAESKMVSLYENQVKLEQNKRGFKKQKETFYNKSEQTIGTGFRDSTLHTGAHEGFQSEIFRGNDPIRMTDEDSQFLNQNSNYVVRTTTERVEYKGKGNPKYIYEQDQDSYNNMRRK
jgi:hypothetical protein